MNIYSLLCCVGTWATKRAGTSKVFHVRLTLLIYLVSKASTYDQRDFSYVPNENVELQMREIYK